jgi:hypothetical protein
MKKTGKKSLRLRTESIRMLASRALTAAAGGSGSSTGPGCIACVGPTGATDQCSLPPSADTCGHVSNACKTAACSGLLQ